MKKTIRFLTSSKFLLALMFILNVALFVVSCLVFPPYVYALVSTFVLLCLMFQVTKDADSSTNALLWFVLILLFPFFSVALRLQLNTSRASKSKRRKYQNITYQSFKTLEQSNTVVENLSKFNLASANISKFVYNAEKWPIYSESATTYLANGELYYADLFNEIKQAKKYVLVQCYKINSGKIWEELFNILRFKAREGVEVKLLYDDFGCLTSFDDKKFFKKLNNHGIETIPFNKFGATLGSFNQCRNHQKLTIIDGKIAFVGGINVGDEYANLKNKQTVWKDCAVKVLGHAVWSYVVMFLNNWQFSSKKFIDVTKYKVTYEKNSKVKEIVQPFETNPITKTNALKESILKTISSAQKYVYITAPYIIFDHDLLLALKQQANSGVEVKLLLPGVSNKKCSNYLTRSYYAELIKAGVKVFEYAQNVVNSKMIVVDDVTVMLGSADFDFRKMFTHFEAGIIIHNSKTVLTAKQDVEKVITSSHAITLRDCKQRKMREKIAARIVRIFTPFM